MKHSELTQLWIICHLLYPNSSQAKDVFSQVLDTVELKKSDFLNVQNLVEKISLEIESKFDQQKIKSYKKLYLIYQKYEPLSSAAKYFEFRAQNLQIWKQFVGKCNKEEKLCLLLIIICRFDFDILGEIFNLHKNKIKHFVNHALKKNFLHQQSPSIKSNNLELIKFGQQKTSQLFINENIVECIFQFADKNIQEKVLSALSENEPMKNFKEGIEFFINEIKSSFENQVVSEEIEYFLDSYIIQKQQHFNKVKSVLPSSSLLILGALVLISSVILIIRPNLNQISHFAKSEKNKITIEELSFSKSQIENKDLILENSIKNEKKSILDIENAIKFDKKNTSVVAKQIVQIDPNLKAQPKEEFKAKPKNELKTEENREFPKAKQNTGLYRGKITVLDFDQVTELLKQKIINLGGKKAGEVELGWTKNQNTSYFHFILPLNHKEELTQFLKDISEFSLVFETHPRLVPSEMNRFIIEVYKEE